ncbi:alpha/beta hydrolase [Caulobacter sp. NIBR1757]|uniref:alpha/beta hydrolase family protein n=1 Tax=Caulobacter sp. NIBR1757 TaxID=3016000 RepID=UPI0022F0075F|nr:alpha/beta hydrolase [Caulobacter sp. NIBR1757]WGM40907.1 hypothetical protein AMEJIAPC_03854 [Caulobacter sp. NIBR1757]
MTILNRRGVLAAMLAAPVAGALFGKALAAPAATQRLQVSPERSTDLMVWAPAKPVAVALLSTGHGSWPERYEGLCQTLVAAGFAVLAPLHVDSMHHPDRETFDARAGFMERLADMRATSAEAARRWPGLSVAAVGHSYGTLISLCLGGALAYMAPFRDPTVKAVLGWSTPGKIPGLVAPPAYAGLAVPTMIITGDQDLVPTFVTDWHDHLFPIETSPAGGKYAVTFAGAAHDLISGQPKAAYDAALTYSAAFLKASVLGDAPAKTLIDTAAGPGETWLRR